MGLNPIGGVEYINLLNGKFALFGLRNNCFFGRSEIFAFHAYNPVVWMREIPFLGEKDAYEPDMESS